MGTKIRKKYLIPLLVLLAAILSAAAYVHRPREKWVSRMKQEIAGSGFQGSYLVAKGDRILLYGGRGKTRAGREIDGNSVLPINSLTKQFCGMAIYQLAAENKLRLSDSLDQYFPNSRYGKEITLQELLSMSSGLPDYTADEVLYKKYGPLFQRSIREEIKYHILSYPPGEKVFQDSNSNYYLLGYIVEILSRSTFDSYIRKHFLEPAKMKHTGFSFRESIISSEYDPVYTFSAGCMCSTVKDLYQWQKFLYSGGFRDIDASRLLQQKSGSYNYGLQFSDGLVQHSGRGKYCRSMMMYDTTNQIHIILLGADDEKEHGELAEALLHIVRENTKETSGEKE